MACKEWPLLLLTATSALTLGDLQTNCSTSQCLRCEDGVESGLGVVDVQAGGGRGWATHLQTAHTKQSGW